MFFEGFLNFQGPPDLKKSSLNPPEGPPDLICPTLFPNPDCKTIACRMPAGAPWNIRGCGIRALKACKRLKDGETGWSKKGLCFMAATKPAAGPFEEVGGRCVRVWEGAGSQRYHIDESVHTAFLRTPAGHYRLLSVS